MAASKRVLQKPPRLLEAPFFDIVHVAGQGLDAIVQVLIRSSSDLFRLSTSLPPLPPLPPPSVSPPPPNSCRNPYRSPVTSADQARYVSNALPHLGVRQDRPEIGNLYPRVIEDNRLTISSPTATPPEIMALAAAPLPADMAPPVRSAGSRCRSAGNAASGHGAAARNATGRQGRRRRGSPGEQALHHGGYDAALNHGADAVYKACQGVVVKPPLKRPRGLARGLFYATESG